MLPSVYCVTLLLRLGDAAVRPNSAQVAKHIKRIVENGEETEERAKSVADAELKDRRYFVPFCFALLIIPEYFDRFMIIENVPRKRSSQD